MKNTKRKALVILLTLVLLITAAGCSQKSAISESSEPEMPTYTQEEMDEMQAALDRLTEENTVLKSENKVSDEETADIPETEETDTLILADVSQASVAPATSTPAAVTAVTFNKSTDLTLNVGDTNRRSAVTTPEGGSVTYTSSEPSIAAVDATGNVTCKATGKAVISATSGGVTTSYNLTVTVATAVVSPNNSAPANTSAASGAGMFSGYKLTIIDKTTSATDMQSRIGDLNSMSFLSATGKELGYMPRTDYLAVIKANEKMVTLPSGAKISMPPSGDSWNEWLAEQFNAYRGVGSSKTATPADAFDADAAAREVVRLVNAERKKAGLSELEIDESMMQLAAVRAEELYESFSHIRPGGGSIMSSHNYFEDAHYGSTSASGAVKAWMNSKGHREAIMFEDNVFIGAGAYHAPNGTRYWIVLFAFE